VIRQPVVFAGLLLWSGLALVLSALPRLRRVSLAERLRPHGRGDTVAVRPVFDVGSWSEVVGSLSRAAGAQAARAVGVVEDVSMRLDRLHAPTTATEFRLRQMGWATAALGGGALVAALAQPPAPVALLFVLGAPVLAFLVIEQSLASASAHWQRTVFLELPIVIEQLAMLVTAGFSLGSALQRVADRGQGECAADLDRVCGRIRQGLSEVEALREWAARAQVGGLDRLVAVLSLNQDASDLGRLISAEARAIRAEVHRELVETMERRGQQVWIPVTVATLVPGVIFLSVPFIEALRVFSGS
jgi:hypothetical protein